MRWTEKYDAENHTGISQLGLRKDYYTVSLIRRAETAIWTNQGVYTRIESQVHFIRAAFQSEGAEPYCRP